jgi:hypothetical protein
MRRRQLEKLMVADGYQPWGSTFECPRNAGASTPADIHVPKELVGSMRLSRISFINRASFLFLGQGDINQI